MAVIDGVFCLRMGAVHRPSWHFSCFTFNQRYNLQKKTKIINPWGSVGLPAPLNDAPDYEQFTWKLVSNIWSFTVAATKTCKAIEFTCLRG